VRELPSLFIFDLDGTLVDTVPDIAVALNAALVELELPPVSEANTRRWVGNGARALCGRAIAQSAEDTADPKLAERLLERFLRCYAARTAHASTIYSGVLDAFAWLQSKDRVLACVTNKPMEHTRKLLRALDLEKFFRIVIGGDSLPRRKPDPLPLIECLRVAGVPPGEAIMIGDSDNDIAAARAAGMDSIAVTYGYSQGRDVNTLGATSVLESLADLPACFEQPRKERAS